MEKLIPDQLTVLGHPQRLAVFRLLMRRYPDCVPAGELAVALGAKPSTMSSYLSALERAGLITQDRAGTSRLYAIHMRNVQQMFGYLLADCCRGRPEICMPFSKGKIPMSDRKYNVLFICTGNSARSIFAESILRKFGGDRFNAYSAGTTPRSELNPFAIDVLRAKGHDISVLHAKHVSAFTGPDSPRIDFIFTVCNQAANEECPPWQGQALSGHWGMPDPVKAVGTDAEKALAFQHAYGALKRRIDAFVALPVNSLDQISLQSAVDDIGRAPTEEQA